MYSNNSASIACLHGRIKGLYKCSFYLFNLILIYIYLFNIYLYYLLIYIYYLFLIFCLFIFIILLFVHFLFFYLVIYFYEICGPGSSVVIASELRAGLSGIESQWGRNIPSVETGPGTDTALCKMGTEYFLGVKCGLGVLLITQPLLVPWSWKSAAKPLPTPWAKPGL